MTPGIGGGGRRIFSFPRAWDRHLDHCCRPPLRHICIGPRLRRLCRQLPGRPCCLMDEQAVKSLHEKHCLHPGWLLVCPWSPSRASRSNLTLTFLTSRLRALHQEPWRFHRRYNTVVIIQWLLPLTRAFPHHSPLSPLLPSYLSPLTSSVMKFAFEIKTKPLTQASIIVTLIAFSSGSLVLIANLLSKPLGQQLLHCWRTSN
jgi:hypothetical protein